MRNLKLLCRVADPAVDLILRGVAHLQAEGDIAVDRLVRIERIALEHHRDIALVRRHVIHQFVIEQEVAAADLFQTGDHVQRRGLAAA